MLKWMTVIGLLGLVAIGAAPERAAAQSPSVVEACAQIVDTPLGKHVIGSIGRLLLLRSELGVTAEQREQIRGIVAGHRPKMVEVAQGMLKQWRALGDAVLAEKIDEKAIRAAAAEFGETLGDAAVVRAKLFREARGVLSNEQIGAVKEFRTEQLKSVETMLKEVAARK